PAGGRGPLARRGKLLRTPASGGAGGVPADDPGDLPHGPARTDHRDRPRGRGLDREDRTMSDDEARRWAVDRIEGETAVLVEHGSGRTAEMGRSGTGTTVREGTLPRVPVSPSGTLLWASAVADTAAEEERLEEGRRILDELRTRDPGG